MSAVEDYANVAETTFINEWADYHRLDFKVDAIKFGDLGKEGQLNALDVLEVLRSGRVVVSDMDECYGLWTIVGETVDETLVEICVRVKSSEDQIELVEMAKI